MARKRKGVGILPVLSMVVIVGGLFASLFLVSQPQKLQTFAKRPGPTSALPSPTPISVPGGCSCTGSASCKKYTNQTKCSGDSKCSWVCAPTPVLLPKPRLITPNGGEEWLRGSTYQITWNQDQKTASTGLYLLQRDSSGDVPIGAIEYNVSNQVGTNSYSWTIPQLGGPLATPPEGAPVVVAVVQYDSSGNMIVSDDSDSPFTVTTPKPTLTSPNGGETWMRGSTYTITWNQSFQAGSTALFMYTRNGSTDTYLGAIDYYLSNKVGTNSYSWTIPPVNGPITSPPDGSNIILSVAQYDANGNLLVQDKSDAPFTIVTPKPTLTSPNGGEVWTRGNTYIVTWNQAYKAASTALLIYTRNGTTDTYLGAIEYYVSNNLGSNSYSWTIPPLGGARTTPPDGSNIILSVAQYDANGNLLIQDKSDSPFTVVSPTP